MCLQESPNSRKLYQQSSSMISSKISFGRVSRADMVQDQVPKMRVKNVTHFERIPGTKPEKLRRGWLGLIIFIDVVLSTQERNLVCEKAFFTSAMFTVLGGVV